ncbi:S41 family peptidase [Xylella fastidiosa subsp. multiplex]|uniref:S41 family peptidase n=1 Tax=Xylella fastidiosa subsp. multiplex TaxID=644357 RepID=A0A9Q4MK17_XYLFS|nr:S41 family peptidase [Xylella fastidiosa]MBE0267956.1 S41 family peptidase [Xylella fastidiosa subsp. multiplex]MBE0274539.1 S41 family peptidase [Xylella fastidiosa subsp. multiplex]MBE0276658.1 S41 family peptidase [Xylella fastidiosa subsp. multiplex]MBE0281066.1 S41 family peptidase [Xylella fastidiosa subsp. multiplex]MRT54454.1 S41 family peptidase [Xylella fastidiosa subsp. multiplex]
MRVVGLSLAISVVLLSFSLSAKNPSGVVMSPPVEEMEMPESNDVNVPLDEIRRFVSVYNAIKQAYVDPVNDRKLMHSAVRGLLSDLDPHSTYFDKEDADAFDEQTSGVYDGIGVELQEQSDNTLKVIAPIDDTPAARAGLRPGDLIVAINGKPLANVDAMKPLRGAPGSQVTLTIVRDKNGKPFDMTIKRETIHIASVRSRMLEPGYGYIRISVFQADTGNDFHKHLGQLKQQAGGRLRGLLLDLRSNPGGLLTAAVQVADALLDKGNIVSTRGRISASDTRFDATQGDLLDGLPLVVLVDAGSASASEVLVGALSDNHRARVIGSCTFGKGSVQTLLPLDNGDSVKLTTARYYTPSGRSIQARGIVPDLLLKPDGVGAADLSGSGIDRSEAGLPGHLRGTDEGVPGCTSSDPLPGDTPIMTALLELKQPGSAVQAKKAIPVKVVSDVKSATKSPLSVFGKDRAVKRVPVVSPTSEQVDGQPSK